MDSFAPVAGSLAALLVALVVYGIALFVLYLIVRLGVRDGILSANRRQAQLNHDQNSPYRS